MIDIIVLMNNDILSLIKTLGSISFQNYKDINVIVVNGTGSSIDKIMNMFNGLNIKIVNTKTSNLKNYGLKYTNSEFILFINSGDLLYNCFSIKNLLVDNNKYDLIAGKIGIYVDDRVDFYNDMNRYTYGKIYRKEIIDKYSLEFSHTKYYSDMAFNKLYLMSKPRKGFCNREVYFTYNGIEDDNNKEYIIDYCKSFTFCIEEAIKNKFDNKEISKTIYSNILYLYNKYNINYDKKFIKYIFEYGKDLYNYYLQYLQYLSLVDKDKINVDYKRNIDYKISLDEFLDMFTVKE